MCGVRVVVMVIVVIWGFWTRIGDCATSMDGGFKVKGFRGIPHMQEMECSAQTLESDAELYSIAIFRHGDGVKIASLMPWKDECLTSSTFSSCHVDKRNPRLSKLVIIVSVSEYEEYEEHLFGCNLTYSSRSAMRKMHWTVALQRVATA
ncbi:hypothetical protein ACOMHN_061618 [Nucella lapillus]